MEKISLDYEYGKLRVVFRFFRFARKITEKGGEKMKGMRKLIEMIMSLIVVAATYAVMHVIFISDLFKLSKQMPAYVPAALAVFTGFIFYFIASTITANALMKRMTQTEERLTKMNVKELALSILGCFIGLVIANLIGFAFRDFGILGTCIIILLNIFFGVLGIRVARRKKDDVNVRTLQEVLMTSKPMPSEDSITGRPKILDTSVIIDGRIMDLLQTGFKNNRGTDVG